MNASPESPAAPCAAHPVAGWRQHHAWSVGASLRRLAKRPFGSLLTVAVMGLALALPLTFYLLLGNIAAVGHALGGPQAINVFLKLNQTAPQAQLLATELRGRADVAKVDVKTPQQGMDELATAQNVSGMLRALDDQNPLPYALVVQPQQGLDAPAVRRLADMLRRQVAVDQVQDAGQWRARLDALLALGWRVVTLLAVLLALTALLVVGNTVRVDITSRSEEIGVLLLLGASRAFVRRPYLYAGLWYGLFAGLFAAMLALMVELALARPVDGLAQVYEGRLPLAGLPLWLLAATPAAAAALGWLGARLVSAWQLRRLG